MAKDKKEVGRPRIFQTPDDLLSAWEIYKNYCDNKTSIKTEFSNKISDFITKEIPTPITYTIEGFAVYNKMDRTTFYDTYVNNDSASNVNHNGAFSHVASRMRDECIVDIRTKLDSGIIDTKLANLYLGRYKDLYSLPKVATDDSQEQLLNRLDTVLEKLGGNI